MRKRRKFADGGVTSVQQPTYPFYGNQPQPGGQSGGLNQTFNMQPQAQAGPNDQMGQTRFAKGGQAKVGKVMSEFKSGKLKSSSGQKVTNPKQAIAIGLSEAGLSKKAKGGEMKESKAMVKKEVSFMKKKGAPKSMIKHEMKEAAMEDGGKVKRMMFGGPARGAAIASAKTQKMSSQAGKMGALASQMGAQMQNQRAQQNKTMMASPTVRSGLAGMGRGLMKKGGAVKKMANGGLAAGHKSADGVATKGKTKAMQVKMAGGKGMKKGGYC
jgi:hypothetical protein